MSPVFCFSFVEKKVSFFKKKRMKKSFVFLQKAGSISWGLLCPSSFFLASSSFSEWADG
jgi:hypothetical protein